MKRSKTVTLDKKNVVHIADLIKTPLTDNEIVKYAKQLTETLAYIENLEEIDTDNIPPTYQTTGITNRFLDEKTNERSLSPNDALKNAREKKNNLFKIPGLAYDK